MNQNARETLSGSRDIKCVEAADLPKRKFPATRGQREARFQVVVKQSVLNDIYRHGGSSSDIEVCGVLVGNVYHDEVGPFLYVEAGIRGEHAGNQAAQVTFTAETWSYIHAEMEKHDATQRILGWYHTHPGFGIFLSAMDLFIEEHFFNLPWQVALVYDPHNGEEGVFVWQAGKAVRDVILVEEDALSRKQQEVAAVAGRLDAATHPARGDRAPAKVGQTATMALSSGISCRRFCRGLAYPVGHLAESVGETKLGHRLHTRPGISGYDWAATERPGK